MTEEECVIYAKLSLHAMELLQRKWKMQILCALRSGPVRLGQLTRMIPLASKKVITENLRELEKVGVIVRRDLSGVVRHVEYDFSEVMRTAVSSILDHLADLGSFHNSKNDRPEGTAEDRFLNKVEMNGGDDC